MKKRIVSMLLALTLVVSGMPVGITAESVNAAEISESEAWAETEETESVIENKDADKEELRQEAGDLITFHVSGDGKAVGSDGVAYDDVVYLSADTVKSFGVEGQSTYVEICDQIAEEKNAGDYLENAVIAVDEDGNLLVQRKVSIKLLQTLMGELTENAFDDEAEDDEKQSTEKIEELPIQEDTKEVDTDESIIEEDLHNKDAEKESGSDEIDAEEVEEASKVESTVEEDSVEKEEASTKEVIEDDVLTEAASVEDEELSTEENLADNAVAEDEMLSTEVNLEEETEAATEEPVLSAENMELIDEPEVEEFEFIENAKADLIVDLGYNKTGDMQHFNSILPTSDYFYKQLTASQKSVYNASKVLGKGKTSFTVSVQSKTDIYQAISAYMITEPYKCDWIDLTKPCTTIDYFVQGTNKYVKTDVSFEKSKYCTPEIQKEANSKVLKLAAEAQAYALNNYPAFPVFGIVEYYDKWICENNYYNEDGTYEIVPADKIETDYYCHSSYGTLLKGYGVCESYALAMTRLLDAIGIPNMYAIGTGNGGGHAWNYIEMPDGKWYLQDSTWNDAGEKSNQYFLLCGDDANTSLGHKPQGTRFSGLTPFTFVERSATPYEGAKGGEIILSKHLMHLEPKKKETLTCNNAYTEDENVSKVWISSNEKVAKVDKDGNVTAVAPGIAEITYVVSGISDSCIVVVSQISSLTFEDSGKANFTTSGNIVEGKGEEEEKEQHIYLTVNQKNGFFAAEDLEINKNDANDEYDEVAEIFEPVKIESSDASVATVTYSIVEDTIDLKVIPAKVGKTKIVITFGNKKATLNYSVGEKLDETWFNLDEVKKLEEESKAGTLMYTGKAYKPKVVLSDAGKAKKVKFKVSYLNNKDAGTATVVITGTGAYGGEIRRTFDIKPLVLNVDTASLKIATSSLYNGGVNQAKSTVKHVNGTKKVGLKVGKDYEIWYTNQDTKERTNMPSKVGTYSMEIMGIGNYAGTVKEGEEEIVPTVAIDGKTWTIEKNDIKKVKVAVKVNGTVPVVTVAIGKNPLPRSDYKLTYYTDKKCEDQIPGSVFMKKTQYFIKVEPAETGSNIEVGAKSKPIVKSFKTK